MRIKLVIYPESYQDARSAKHKKQLGHSLLQLYTTLGCNRWFTAYGTGLCMIFYQCLLLSVSIALRTIL